MPPDRRQDDTPAAGPPPADFVLGAAERALARKSPELAAALNGIAERHERLQVDAGRFRSMVERVPAIVYIADAGPSGCWHYVSPQIEAVLGYSREEWTANPNFWAERLHPEDRPDVLDRETEAVAGSP